MHPARTKGPQPWPDMCAKPPALQRSVHAECASYPMIGSLVGAAEASSAFHHFPCSGFPPMRGPAAEQRDVRFRTNCVWRSVRSACPAALNLSIRAHGGSLSPPMSAAALRSALGAQYCPSINAPVKVVLPAYPTWGPPFSRTCILCRKNRACTLVQDLKLAVWFFSP